MAVLTPEEKKEIIACLEADQPLPYKYRFLLFAPANDVEVIWPGKGAAPDCPDLDFRLAECYEAGKWRILPNDPVWRNRLFFGDNLAVLSFLARDPMRAEIQRQGGVKLIYIDPPFAVGADFSLPIALGPETKSRGKALAYHDCWRPGSYIRMMHERLKLMHGLLAEDGCIYVHCDWRQNAWLRLLLDDIFQFHVNEIIWHYTGGGRSEKYFSRKHDTILVYSKSGRFKFNGNDLRVPYKETSGYAKNGIVSKTGKRYLPHPQGALPDDVWELPIINPLSKERLGYPTQKPEALLERVIKASSDPGDLVADFFCGSGTLPAVASRLGRKWLAADSGKFAIHTARKRLLAGNTQPAPFEVLKPCALKPGPANAEYEKNFADLVLNAYGAEKAKDNSFFQGQKQGRQILIALPHATVNHAFMRAALAQCRKQNIQNLDLLACSFAPGLFPAWTGRAKKQGLSLAPKIIPPEIFAFPQAAPRKIHFHNLPFLEAVCSVQENSVCVDLTGFYYTGAANEPYAGFRKDQEGETPWPLWIDYWGAAFIDAPEQDRPVFAPVWHCRRDQNGLDLKSPYLPLPKGAAAILVKAWDIFANETGLVLEINY